MSSGRSAPVRRLNEPRPVRVWLGGDDRPARVEWRGAVRAVEAVLDTWFVDDAWWGERPVSRVYHEVQLVTGVRLVLVWDLVAGRWLAQR